MSAQNAFTSAANAFNGGSGTVVPRIGVEADSQHLPILKSMAQHQEFGFCVCTGADRGLREPGVADLTRVGFSAPMRRMALGPSPAFQVPETRRADDDPVLCANNREWQSSAGALPCQRGVDIFFCGV